MIDWPTYNDLRASANDESLSYGELAQIEAAFAEVPDEQLRDRRENAMADDMLDEIATFLAHGHPVFVTDEGIVPTCDLCNGPQRAEGDDWNGETGNHRSCEEKPDFVDVHVALDWVIRVHGTTEEEAAKDIATDYLADQNLHRLVEMLVHEDGVLCDGEDLTSELDDDGNLAESELTIALYPEGTELPTNVPVAVSTYGPVTPELRS